MGVSALMTALVELVGDVLVNDVLLPAPDRALRYYGLTMPKDCCTENGYLVATWADGRASTKFPASAASQQDDLCSAKLVTTISVRWVRCWPVPQATEDGLLLTPEQDAEWDRVSALLTDAAEIVARNLISLECVNPLDPDLDSFVKAVVDEVAPLRWLRFLDVAPIVPDGGCAGVLWRLQAAARPLVAVAS